MATAATASQKTGSPLLFRLGGAGEEESSPTMNTAALIREVTQDFGDMMEEKLSKFKETLEKKSTTLVSQSKRITEAECRMWRIQGRIDEAEKTIKLMANDMENRSRRDSICVLILKEGTEGKTLSTSSKLGCLPCLVWKRLPALKAASKLTGRTGAWSSGVCVPAR